MTGLPNFNHDEFHRYAAEFRRQGYDIYSPAECFNGRTDLSRETYLRRAAYEMSFCYWVACLPNWELAEGARAECYIARRMLFVPIYDAQSIYDEELRQIYPRLSVVYTGEPSLDDVVGECVY